VSEECEQPDGSQDEPDNRRWRRDLGSGHPLSPGAGAAGGNRSRTGVQAADTHPTDDTHPADDTDQVTTEERFDPADRETSTYSRRGLLLSGVAGVGAASLGWATLLGIGGGSSLAGAERVAADYVNAIDDNDWAAAGALFHEESEFGQETVSYERWLEQRGRFEGYRDISPSVDAQFTFFHVTDPEQAAAEGESLGVDLDPTTIAELKRVAAVVSVRQENLDTTAADAEYLGSSKSSFSFTLIRSDAGWRILSVFGPA